MDQAPRPLRSVLYVPGDRPRAIDKARGLDCDAVVFDLEDAVAPAAKDAARDAVRRALAEGGHGPRLRIVRVNAGERGRADLAALAPEAPDAILLPKVEAPDDVARAAALLDAVPAAEGTRLWAMVETPRGVLEAAAIARAPRMAALVVGANDLVAAIGCRPGPDRAPLVPALAQCVLAARAAGIACIDGVRNALDDAEGLAAECAQGRDLGMDGKSLIHPAQIAAANAAFAPSGDELARARAHLDAFRAAEAEGRGVAVVEGRIVEGLHAAAAERLLARAAAAPGEATP